MPLSSITLAKFHLPNTSFYNFDIDPPANALASHLVSRDPDLSRRLIFHATDLLNITTEVLREYDVVLLAALVGLDKEAKRSDIAIVHFVDTLITYKNARFFSTFVYGAHEIPNRQALWEQLTDIAAAKDTLWFLTGDFNEIIDNLEKSGGKERPGSFLSSCHLFDLRHSGDFLTWRESDIQTLSIPDWIGSDKYPTGRCLYLPLCRVRS
ncbi:hypothetical protein DY000_02041917 [Brassica cretica]|uniref:Nicotianamine synthase n=1 Tax=Brassica cretica TaxID=69181 RepID=A0ABQ7B6N7_BRACR|nr:hypothetical protein DY000_02041917 [Brassica cretica]